MPSVPHSKTSNSLTIFLNLIHEPTTNFIFISINAHPSQVAKSKLAIERNICQYFI
jgi:hypothetical protein